MASPSEPLLQHLRQLLKTRGMNTAGLANAAGLDRDRVRRVLGGSEPLTVDELIVLAQALQLQPTDLGLPSEAVELAEQELAAQPEARETDLADIEEALNPYGNQVSQLFEVGFALGCDFFFHAHTADLQGSGVPESVLSRYADAELPIRLDAAYHADHEPRLEADGVHLRLGFDALYDCFFPWAAIRQVRFFPATPEPDDEPQAEPVEPSPKAPFLRLVE